MSPTWAALKPRLKNGNVEISNNQYRQGSTSSRARDQDPSQLRFDLSEDFFRFLGMQLRGAVCRKPEDEKNIFHLEKRRRGEEEEKKII